MTISWTRLPAVIQKGFAGRRRKTRGGFAGAGRRRTERLSCRMNVIPQGGALLFFGIDTALEQKGPEHENALKILTKKRLFIAKHYDFLIVDLAALILGYWLSLAFRRSLDITLRNQNLLWTYGIAALLSFLLVEILTENLNGIITRGLVREVQAVALQMTLTWTV